LHAAGLRFAIAREAGLSNAHNLRNLAHEAGAAVAHGLPAEVALRAITLDAAELLGVADQLGSLQVGKLATLIVCSGDVMEPASQVLRAWVRGREIDLRNRQTRLTEKYRQP
jgi:imidazolonepropionase-like amidohydrolase